MICRSQSSPCTFLCTSASFIHRCKCDKSTEIERLVSEGATGDEVACGVPKYLSTENEQVLVAAKARQTYGFPVIVGVDRPGMSDPDALSRSRRARGAGGANGPSRAALTQNANRHKRTSRYLVPDVAIDVAVSSLACQLLSVLACLVLVYSYFDFRAFLEALLEVVNDSADGALYS